MPRGRPTKFKPEYVEQARKLAALGATDREVADFFGVKESTLHLWKHVHPEFSEALNLGKDPADKRVKQSLYRRAIGYSHDDVHVSTYEGKVTLTPIVKHYPPDPTSMIFWLKNRRKDEWREKPDETPTDLQATAAAIKEIMRAAEAETDGDA